MDELLATDVTRPSLKRLGGAFVGLLQNHLELISIEIQEEKSRTFRLFIISGLCLIFGLLVLLGLSTALIIAFWDSYRMATTLGLCAFYGVAMLICFGKARQLAHEAESPFQATVEELARSREQLRP
jgi:uncharacterized membrane protein YqjE